MDERFLYQIMNELYCMEAPIIFKGALITKLVLEEFNNPSKMQRETRDIDADWIGKEPSMDELRGYIQAAVDNIRPGLIVEAKREYGERRAAGFAIYNQNMEKVTSLDISVRQNPYYRMYEFENMRFRGANVDKILVDKISAISSERIIRRVKDLADVYALSLCTTYEGGRLKEMADVTGRKIGDFAYFDNHKHELQEAYGKLKDIEGKRPFEAVYAKVAEFTRPLRVVEPEGKVEVPSVRRENKKKPEVSGPRL